jgi:hypothetical protein
MAPPAGARVTGLAVTDKGRVYASLFAMQEESDTKTHGLFELRAEPNASVGNWIVVNGTLNSQARVGDAPKGSFFRLRAWIMSIWLSAAYSMQICHGCE